MPLGALATNLVVASPRGAEPETTLGIDDAREVRG